MIYFFVFRSVPTSIINLEVWVPEIWLPPENNTSLLDVYHVRECGNIAPPGRFGWFIPVQLANPIRTMSRWWTQEMEDLHWTIFRDVSASSVFSIQNKNDLKLIQKYSYKNHSSGE